MYHVLNNSKTMNNKEEETDTCSLSFNIWDNKVNNILSDTIHSLKLKIAAHTMFYKRMYRNHNIMTFAIHSINVCAASSNFLLLGIIPEDHLIWVNIITGVLVLLSSMVSGIQNTVDYKKKFELHEIAVSLYENIRSDIEKQQVIPLQQRGDPFTFMTNIHKNVLLIDHISPYISINEDKIRKYIPSGSFDVIFDELKDKTTNIIDMFNIDNVKDFSENKILSYAI